MYAFMMIEFKSFVMFLTTDCVFVTHYCPVDIMWKEEQKWQIHQDTVETCNYMAKEQIVSIC